MRANAQHGGRWETAWRWVHGLRRRFSARPQKLLRLTESLPLGERRFLAVVEFDRQKFLIGGTSSSVCLLAELGRRAFQAVATETQRDMEDVWP